MKPQSSGYATRSWPAGRRQALVNNAGYSIRGGMSDATVASWSEVLGVNLTSVYSMTKHFLPLLLAARTPPS